MYNHWLRCDISAGMFSDEFTVVIRDHTPNLSFFAPACMIRTPQKDAVRCGLVNTENGTTRIVLPVQPYEQASRVLDVPTQHVEPV